MSDAEKAYLADLARRDERWKSLVQCLVLSKSTMRVRLVLYRSGCGSNSVVIDTGYGGVETPRLLSKALWRQNENFEQIMSVEHAPVHVPGLVPPSLGRTIAPGIDTAGICIWDGFYDPNADKWEGVLMRAHVFHDSGCRITNDEGELRQLIAQRKLTLKESE